MKKVEEIFAFVIVDDDGDEGVPAVMVGDMWVPMVGADPGRIESLHPYAQEVATAKDRRVSLRHFKLTREMEVIEP